jgi:hypothetical protein
MVGLTMNNPYETRSAEESAELGYPVRHDLLSEMESPYAISLSPYEETESPYEAIESPYEATESPYDGSAALLEESPYPAAARSYPGGIRSFGYAAPPFPGYGNGPRLAQCTPLRAIHIGQSMVRAGVEQWLKALIRFADPRRLQVVRCVVTSREDFDPEVAAEMPIPVELGTREAVRRAASDCDVLLCWGPHQLGEWLRDCRPKLSLFVAHGEGKWTRYILNGCAPVMDHAVAVSRRAKEHIANGTPASVIYNGVDPVHLTRTQDRASARAQLGFRPDDFVLGFVGRFSPEKRPQLLLEATAALPANFKCLFVGWGPLEWHLMKRANQLIPGRYAFVVGKQYLGDCYAVMDAACMVSAEEGYSMVSMEAMMCERPVIATAVGCIPEFLEDRVNGLIVEPTAVSIAAAALRLRDNPLWARGLVAQAKAFAEQQGHARIMARRYVDLIESLWRQKYGKLPGEDGAPVAYQRSS